MPFKDHFQTLRVSHRATPQQVQKAYYERLKFFHPDYFQDDGPRRAIAEAETKSLNEAFEILGKAGDREQYITEWERHQNPQRSGDRSLALEQSLLDVRTDLSEARRRISELKSTLAQRDRELEAANLGMRQGYQRVTSLQEAAQTYQERARLLQTQLMERDLELQEAKGRADGLERYLPRLQAEMEQVRQDSLRAEQAVGSQRDRLTEAERQLAESQRELDLLRREGMVRGKEAGLSTAPEAGPEADAEDLRRSEKWRAAVAAAQESMQAAQGQVSEKESELQLLRQSAAVATDRAQQQQILIDKAANQIRALQERLAVLQAEIRRDVNSAAIATQLPLMGETEEETLQRKAQIQELAAALAQRTEEARQAQLRAEALEAQVRGMEGSGHGGASVEANTTGTSRLTLAVDRMATWLTPQRATTIMTGLMLALCAVAVTLVILTVSIDLPALASGLGRLGPGLSSLLPR